MSLLRSHFMSLMSALRPHFVSLMLPRVSQMLLSKSEYLVQMLSLMSVRSPLTFPIPLSSSDLS